MKVVRTIAEMRQPQNGRVALVPTMGAFHEGHLSLMRQGKQECDTLVCSLFVNPTQFGPGEDFERYPRNEDRDFEMAEAQGVDIMFAPLVGEMYRDKNAVVSVRGVSDRWEGAHRPGHFDGVATVVCKLFNIVRPDISLFGLKDLQQCAVIKRMVFSLDMPIELKFCATFREQDGLAMSSRNVYLSPAERAIAPTLFQQLSTTARVLEKVKDPAKTSQALNDAKGYLNHAGFNVDYLALVDTETMEPKTVGESGDSVIAAAHLGRTRLLDNVQLA